MKELHYNFEEGQERRSLVLPAGVVTYAALLLPALTQPVVWCPADQAVVQTEHVTVTKTGVGAPAAAPILEDEGGEEGRRG